MSVSRRFLPLLAATTLLLTGCATVAGTAVPAGTAPTPGQGTTGDPTAPQITRPADADPGAAPDDLPAAPAGLESYYAQELSWSSCDEFGPGVATTPDLDCASLTVPLSYEEPELADLQIAVLRAAATGPDRIGALLVNPGGPGASGVEFVSTYARLIGNTSNATGRTVTDLNGSFDLIGFDPRGVGASRPTVACQTDEERDASRALYGPTTDETVALANAATQAVVQACVSRMSHDGVDGATVLAHFGTRDAARDMDVLRAALRDPALTFLGYSYGTKLGYIYAEQFPDRVRAMVLDGAVAPDSDPVSSMLGQAEGFQRAFEAFATWCAGLATCPLGDDPALATAVLQQLTRPLVESPLPLADGRILTYGDATNGVAAALYQDGMRQLLVGALLDLAQGKGDQLMGLADWYLDRDESGHYSNSMEAFNAIRCMDDARITDPDDATELMHQYNLLAPFQDSGQPPAAFLDVCAFWPAEPTWTPHELDIPDLTAPILVISTTGDPATPYEDGVRLADQLGADLLTYTGDRHTAFLGAGSSCVDQVVLAYLKDPAATGDQNC